MGLILNVYADDKKTVKKQCEGQTCEIMFGTIRKLMGLLNIDSVDDMSTLLFQVYDVWEEVTAILAECFPDMEEDDWNHVKIKELLPLLVDILKFAFSEILSIPSDSKN